MGYAMLRDVLNGPNSQEIVGDASCTLGLTPEMIGFVVLTIVWDIISLKLAVQPLSHGTMVVIQLSKAIKLR